MVFSHWQQALRWSVLMVLVTPIPLWVTLGAVVFSLTSVLPSGCWCRAISARPTTTQSPLQQSRHCALEEDPHHRSDRSGTAVKLAKGLTTDDTCVTGLLAKWGGGGGVLPPPKKIPHSGLPNKLPPPLHQEGGQPPT